MIPREILKKVRRVEITTRGLVNEVFSGEYHSVFKGRGMSFAEHLAAFRARHPDMEVADVYITDLNGVARGKLVPAGMLDKLANGGLKMPVSTLGSQLPFHSPLGGDAGVVGTGQPEGRHAAHATPANQSILQGFLQGVSQMQLAGDVGGRHDYAVRSLVRVLRRGEEALVQPILIDALLNVGGVISPGHVRSGSGSHSRSLPEGE